MDSQNKTQQYNVNLLELVHILVKRKMLIAKICSAAIVISVVYSLTSVNIYSATAKILPPQKEGGGGLSALLGQSGGLAGIAAGGLGGGSDLYLGILKSRSVGDAVIRRLDLQKVYQTKTLEATRTRLNGVVNYQAGKDGIISISAEDRDPKRSALLANTIVDELAKTTVRLNLTKAGTERVFLEKRLDVVKADLKNVEDDLKSFAQRNKIVQVESQAQASITGIARMKAELASKEVQLAVLRSMQTNQSGEVKALDAGIRRLRGEISHLAGNESGGEGIPSVGNVPGVGLEYNRKIRALKTQEAIYEQLMKQYEMVKLSEAKDTSSLQILDAAVVPENRCKPKRSQLVILATVTAFFASIFIVLMLEAVEGMSENNRAIWNKIKKQAVSLK